MSLLSKWFARLNAFLRRKQPSAEVLTDQSLQRLRFIEYMVDKSPDIVFWVDVQSEVITYVDETALDLLDYDQATLMSLSIQHIDPSTQNWQGLLMRLSDHAVWTRESYLLSRQGESIPIEATYFLISFAGQQTLVLSGRDIRERKLMEGQIQQQMSAIQDSRRATANMLLDLAQAKRALEQTHQRTKDSIDYAALIQYALMPDDALFKQSMRDHFVLWLPKDVVGGDIYFLTHLRQRDGWLCMVIDCTGHGVPGAFVTMLVKAIEQQIVTNLQLNQEPISPAHILALFNRGIKFLLKQEHNSALNNVGFDAAVIYYQQQAQQLVFAGANLPLYHVRGEQLSLLKGDRHSVGYKNSDADYVFTDRVIALQAQDCVYLATDGYADQNGGDKGFPLGKTNLSNALLSYSHLPMAEQKSKLLGYLQSYQGKEMRNDDITLIGLRF